MDWRVRTNCNAAASAFTVAQYSVPCPAPSGLTVTNITPASATLNWLPAPGFNNFVSDFVVSYRLAGTNNAWIQIGHTFGSSINISGLTPGTAYEWCVNQTCINFNSNPVIAQFTTATPACAAPTGLYISAIFSNQVTVNWNSVNYAVQYTVQYKPASSSNWLGSIITSALNTTITGLNPSTLYDWRVMTNCNGSQSSYTAAQFTTAVAVACGVPTGLFANNVTNNSAVLNWNAINGASSYTLQYRILNTGNWVSINNLSGTSYLLNNCSLMNTTYEFRVKTKCGGEFSNYSSPATFTTLNCVAYGNNSQEWIDLFKIGSINRVSGAETGGYINTGISTNLVIGSTGNAGQISAGFASTIRNQNYCIYIDLNHNGIYEHTERVFGSALISGAGTINFSFSIPGTATPGTTGLRVSMRRNGSGGISPCMTTGFGETEDYIVNLTAVSSRSSVVNLQNDWNDKFETVVTVSPNPSEGIFNISLPKNIQAVFYDVVDLNGAVLQKQNIAGNSVFNIDITDKSKGLYLLRITDQSGKQKTYKLLKN